MVISANVLGGGPTGTSGAAAAGLLGKRVALAEMNPQLGIIEACPIEEFEVDAEQSSRAPPAAYDALAERKNLV